MLRSIISGSYFSVLSPVVFFLRKQCELPALLLASPMRTHSMWGGVLTYNFTRQKQTQSTSILMSYMSLQIKFMYSVNIPIQNWHETWELRGTTQHSSTQHWNITEPIPSYHQNETTTSAPPKKTQPECSFPRRWRSLLEEATKSYVPNDEDLHSCRAVGWGLDRKDQWFKESSSVESVGKRNKHLGFAWPRCEWKKWTNKNSPKRWLKIVVYHG